MKVNYTQGTYLEPKQIDTIHEGIRSKFALDSFSKKSSFNYDHIEALKSMKISLDGIQEIEALKDSMSFGMDTTVNTPYPSSVTTNTVATPIQKLQNWLPGFINILTAKRVGDEVTGIFLTGSWEDQQIVRGDIEMLGFPGEYDDYSNLNFASDQVNWTTRTVVRFAMGMSVGLLETAQSARMNVNPSQWKMNSCAYNLEVIRNQTNWYGFNNGANQTYGILTDPNLSAWQSVPLNAGSTSTNWANKTAVEIYTDILTAWQDLVSGASGNIDFYRTPSKLVVANDAYTWLLQTTTFLQGAGTVLEFLKMTFPKMEVINAVQLNDAYSNENGFYLFADIIDDDSTDGGRTWIQPIPARFQNLGVRQDIQSYSQGFVMATAGAFCQRPWAVTRWYGI